MVWGQLNFQEGTSVIIELLNYFHDYIIIILLIILTFVTYLFIIISFNTRLDKNTIDSHVLETIWTVLPIVILLFIAFPSLYLLYLIEDLSSPSLTVKVIGHQWYWEYQYRNSWFNYSFDSYIIHDSSEFTLFYSIFPSGREQLFRKPESLDWDILQSLGGLDHGGEDHLLCNRGSAGQHLTGLPPLRPPVGTKHLCINMLILTQYEAIVLKILQDFALEKTCDLCGDSNPRL